MSLFIAVPVDGEVQEKIERLIGELRATGADFNWVKAAKLHLTLSFQGEVPADKIPKLQKAMSEAVEGQKAFRLVLGELGVFDSFSRPRVIWLGLSEGLKPLEALAAALKTAVGRAGLLSEAEQKRAFKAHLSLGRMRGRNNLKELRAVLRARKSGLDVGFMVEKIVLYESRDSRYELLAEVPLGRSI